jgi:flagellar basal-body rod protein FlgB
MAYDFGFIDAAHATQMQQHNLDVISNNLANVNTPGFKGDRLVFSHLMDRQTRTAYDQGSLKATENPLDVAITGQGFFRVQTDKGPRLTRDGAFKMFSDGSLVTSGGLKVLDQGGQPITLNPNGPPVHIDEVGNVYQGVEQLGTLAVVDVTDKKAMVKEGSSLFGGQDGKPLATTPATDYSVLQGHVEMSNVDTLSEMVGMINAHRNFESYQKSLQAMQDIDNRAISQVGKVA